MINEIGPNKTSLKIESKNSSFKLTAAKSVKAETSSPAVTRNSSNAKSAVSLAASLGLPPDKLSSSIVSFARFFSLPLKPEMLAALRRQVLCAKLPQSSKTSSPASSNLTAASLSNQQAAQNPANAAETSSLLKMREALSLAAAAAESKGVELNIKGLETYADAIDPDWLPQRSFQQEQHGEEHQHDNRDKNKNDQEEKKQQKENAINVDSLKKIANEFARNNKLLDILNRLPSKNGKRWIVLPFEFFDDGKQYKVSMRVLMEDDSRASRIALQISINDEHLAENSEQLTGNNEKKTVNIEKIPNKKRLFSFDFSNNQLVKVTFLISDDINLNEQNKFKKELSKSMDISAEKIFVKCSKENFPCETDCDEKYLSIDEAI